MNFVLNREKATLLIPISEIAIPRKVVEYAEKNGYKIKNEFHITLLSFQNGKKVLGAMRDTLGFTFDDIVNLAQSYTWETEFLLEYFALERTIPEFVLHGQIQTPKHTRRSLIQKVSTPDMLSFLSELEKMTGAQFDNPVEHVTLFTWSDYLPETQSGIALNNQTDFEKYLLKEI